MSPLAPPTALIVGASGTLGGRIASELGVRGYALGLHAHSHPEACARLAEAAAARGTRAVCYAADFRDTGAPAALAASFLKDFGRIDALVWASGLTRDAPLLTLREEDLREVLNVDLRAFFLLLKAFTRTFLKQKAGSVVALSSHAGLAGRAGGVPYAMAHSGLLALVKSAAREFGPYGARINAVLPPFVPESGLGRTATPEFAAAAKARAVLKKELDGAGAVAQFVAAILENPAVAGQVLCVDSRITGV